MGWKSRAAPEVVFQAVQLELLDQSLLKFRQVAVLAAALEQKVVSLRRCQNLKEHRVSIL